LAPCLLLLIVTPLGAAEGKKFSIKPGTADPPKELNESIRKLLDSKTVQLLDPGGNLICEVWLCKQLPSDAALEEQLGVRLVHRTTRKLHLTDAGMEFYRRAKTVLADLREAEAVITEAMVKPSGVLRVTASLSFCMLHIEPLLPAFTARFPDISVEVVAANRYYDIIDNNIDLAIRTRQFEADSNITIRRLASTRRVLAASPAYLKRRGKPKTPEDLTSHSMLIYSYAINPSELNFRRGDEKTSVIVKSLLEANDGQIIVRAALDGMGILVQPKYIVQDHIASGALMPVLDEWDLPRLTINFAFQTRAHVPAKVRLFMDAMIEHFKANEFERLWTSLFK
jgi:DNA-binding transcriptional LysR family regulator